MRIVIAPDSFKECLSAAQVCRAIETGLRRALPDAELISVPMADGGEGTVDALVASTSGEYVDAEVRGPLGDTVQARYGMLGDGRGAVIEMAAASGLPLVPPEGRDAGAASTYGTGELIRHAIGRGAKRILLGLGGSATTDGGAGMAQALGYSLLDGAGRELDAGGLALADLASIENRDTVTALLDGIEIRAACDVDNVLCGPQGSAFTYGPQKGADPETVRRLDDALRRLGNVIEAQLGLRVHDVPGAGAAGGLGAGVLAFAKGRLCPGVDLVAQACDLEARMAGADLVITGEGCLDGQSAHGKTPVGVAQLAKKTQIPVVAIAGILGEGHEAVCNLGIDRVFCICKGPADRSAAMEQAEVRLAEMAQTVGADVARGV